jgi:hypothetical protein
MDTILLATVAIIFLTALLSRIVQRHDRVLKSLKDYHIRIRKDSGKDLWGRARIFANGMQLFFSKPYQSSGGEWVDSYILYAPELEDIRTIYRYHDELSPQNRKRRIREIKRVAKPGAMRRLLRSARNFTSNFQEAVSETIGVFMNRFKGGGAELLKTSEKHLKEASTTVLGAVGKEFDPILEKHLNKKVVVSLQLPEGHCEFSGFLGEYSEKWLALMHCKQKRDWRLPLNDMNRLILNRDLDVAFQVFHDANGFRLELEISNHANRPITLKKISGEGFIKRLDKMIKPQRKATVGLDALPAGIFPDCEANQPHSPRVEAIAPERGGHYHPEAWSEIQHHLPALELVYAATRRVDVYCPRRLATVRHSVSLQGPGQNRKPTLTLY